MTRLLVHPEVDAALAAGKPVVALETSIVAQGLPAPHNLDAALGCEQRIRDRGAVPATTAVLDGCLRVGLSEGELRSLAARSAARKVSSRDLGPALASRAAGATTVAATMRIAEMAGIRFMATGGIGGVHRGDVDDVSADLAELARTRVAVFCAGPKLVLDVRRTLERLDSSAVPVVAWRSDRVPAFYVPDSGFAAPARADTAEDLVQLLAAAWRTGARGIVIAVPPPRELAGAEEMVARAQREAGKVTGDEVTPRLLARVAELSGNASVDLNVELVVNNAGVAAECAAAWARRAG